MAMANENGHLSKIKGNLKDIVIDHVRTALFEKRTLRCGDQINERELSRVLELSRAPIREALKELEEQGLIVSVRYKGWFVADFREGEFSEINRLRTLLEHSLLETVIECGGPSDGELERAVAMNREMERILDDPSGGDRKMFRFAEKEMEFHDYLHSLARGDCFWTKKMLRNLSYQIRCSFDRRLCLEDIMRASVESHDQLLDCLRAKDATRLRKLLFRRLELCPISMPERDSDAGAARPGERTTV